MSLRSFRRLTAALTAWFAGAALLASPAAAQSGTIAGKVTNAATGAGVSSAQVQVAGLGLGTVTADDGSYRIGNVPAGTYTVIVRRIGFQERRATGVAVSASGTATVNVVLEEATSILTAVAVTGTRNQPEKVLDAPAQISVISSERIAERPAVTVADNLRATPGVDISRGGIAQTNIVARGFNNAFSGSMLMLQDYRFAGVPSLRVNVPFLFTGTNEDIERMEVLLGPASALYGPNSANGVLHIISKSPFTSQGTTVSIDGGERSVLRAGLRHAGTVGEKFGFKFSGEMMRGKDFEYDDPAEPNVFSQFAPAARRGQSNARSFDLERYTGEARIDIRPREGMELISTAGYTNVASGLELTGANGTAQIKGWTYTNLQQRFRWNRLFAQAFINMSNAGNDNSSSSDGTYLLRSGQPIVDKSSVAAFQLQHGFDMASNKQTFTYGIDYIATRPETGRTINGSNEDNDNVTEYGAYIQSQTRPSDKFELLLAARVDANNVIEGEFFSPRAALIYKPTPSQNFRATYNRAFSTPANFSFFLDLIQTPNVGGSGYDIIALGNRPKEGWSFRRDCGGPMGGLCMRSPFYGGNFGAASAANSFGPLVAANGSTISGLLGPAFVGALQQAGLPAAQAQVLGAQLAGGLVQFLGARRPTDAELSTRMLLLPDLTNSVNPANVRDIEPLKASFSSTYEIGYKGVLGNRLTLDISGWRQARGDVGTSAALATPWVLFGNPQQLGGYIGAQTGAFLVQQLTPVIGAANAAAFAGLVAPQVAGQLAPRLAPAPLGVVTFDGANIKPNGLYATYQTVESDPLWITGLDLATSFAATPRLSLEATYSYANRNVFEGINGGNGAPLMSNAPRSRGTAGFRFDDAERAYSFSALARYSDAYPVNSGVYATNVAFPIPAGNPGAIANAAGGYNRCNPAPAGTFCYDNVPSFMTLDLQFSKTFDLGGNQFRWSVTGQNILNNEVATFPGVPAIGRLVMTRLQYSF